MSRLENRRASTPRRASPPAGHLSHTQRPAGTLPTIECYGFCGSGKSTIAAALVEPLAARGLIVGRPATTHRGGFAELVARHPIVMARAVADPRSIRPLLATQTGRISTLALLRQHDIARICHGWTLLDEGALQRAWIVRTRVGDLPSDAVARVLPLNALVLHVQVSPETAQRRIRGRGRDLSTAPMNKSLAEEQLDGAFWTRAIAMMSSLGTTLAQRGDRVVTIDHETAIDPGEVADEIVEALRVR